MRAFLAGAVALSTVSYALAAPTYYIAPLSDSGGYTLDSYTSINNFGAVAGTGHLADNSYVALQNSIGGSASVIRVNTYDTRATGISDSGSMALNVAGGYLVYRREANGTLTNATPTGFAGGYVYGINSSGWMSGVAYVASGVDPHAYSFYNQFSGTQLFAEGSRISNALAISDNNALVGYRQLTAGGPEQGFFVKGGNTLAIPGLAGSVSSRTLDVNNSDVVVGQSSDGQFNYGFTWTQSGGVVPLAGVTGSLRATAFKISNTGLMLGNSVFSTGDVPTLWQNGSAYDLNSLFDQTLSGWSNVTYSDINDSGQIVGSGVYGGVRRGFIAAPVPEPATMLALPFGLIALAALKRRLR